VPTSKNPSLQEKYRFFVDAIASPIFPFQNEDVRVEVYQHKTGSISRVNMYEPDRVFEIRKSSGTSTNVSAQYWHVFNLVENTETQKFEIVPVEKIRTDYTQVLNDT
jgi:hypothetical protein